jgi:hypothetical protein
MDATLGPEVAIDVQVKGMAANGLAAFLRQELSPQQLRRLEQTGSAEAARVLAGGMLANETVSLDVLNDLTTRAAELTKAPVFDFARRAGRFGGEVAIRSVYKFILSLLSPATTCRAIPTLWGRVYNAGRVTVEVGEGEGRFEVHDFPASEAQCGRFTGWLDFVGSATSTARNVRIEHTSCRARGDGACVWQARWQRA